MAPLDKLVASIEMTPSSLDDDDAQPTPAGGTMTTREALMEERKKFSVLKLKSFRPGLRGRSKTFTGVLGVGVSTTKLNDDDDDDTRSPDKGTNSTSLPPFPREHLSPLSKMNRHVSVPILGATGMTVTGSAAKGGGSEINRYMINNKIPQDLSFEDAKKIWLREFESIRRDENGYSFSSFESDLELSLASLTTTDATAMLSSSMLLSSSCIIDEEEDYDEQEEVVPVVKKEVKFSNITIREYPMIPGDNPATSYGVPMTIDWVPYDPVSVGLDSYEKWRVPNRRRQHEMRIPSRRREMVLRNLGFPTMMLRESIKEADIVRKQRYRSNSIGYMDKANEHFESTIRGLQNALTLGRKNRRERAYLEQYVPSYHSDNRHYHHHTTLGPKKKDNNRRASAPPEPSNNTNRKRRPSLRDILRRSSAPPSTVKGV